MHSPQRQPHSPRVLFATPEVYPLVQTGGLADVSACLPAALLSAGTDVRVLVPGYPQVLAGLQHRSPVAVIPAHASLPGAQLLSGRLPSGVPLYVLECPTLYDRPGGPYQDANRTDWPDNAQRFGLLSHAAALLASGSTPLPWHPQIVHCNDWQSALAPAYLEYLPGPHARSLVSVHNLAFQGLFPLTIASAIGLPTAALGMDGVEYWGKLSFLKGGLFYADQITTVSPSYAEEIQKEPLGFGLQGLLAHRRAHLTGILNGIDTEVWNPAADRRIPAPYSAQTLDAKAANKAALQERLGLEVAPDVPLLGCISRVTEQKGLDMLPAVVKKLAALPAQLAVLGSGETALEQALSELPRLYPGAVSVTIGFDEDLAHLIEAGADIFLMPSRFEPCGLNQMYSQRYGTPPVVHATGGLRDSVVNTTRATLAAGTASGFVFNKPTPAALLAAVRRAMAAYRDARLWRAIQRNGMARDFSWDAAASRYRAVYQRLLGEG